MAALVATSCAADLGTPEVPDDGPPLPLTPDGKLDGASFEAYGPLPEGPWRDEPFQALFAPDDPVVTLELSEIQRVRDARLADPAAYAEGDNPYRIRYAVYNLRNPDLVGALADAQDDGVDVQVLIDADQLDPARDYNVADEQLVARGFELVTDHRALDDATRRTADLIGIVSSGLMHLKTRIFETPAGSVVLSGSFNPGDNAVLNEETFHRITDPTLVARYTAAYESVLRGERIANTWDDAAAVNVLFTPAASGPRAGGRLLSWIAEEDELILLMVFSLRDITGEGASGSLVDALGERARAGVPVYVITDRKQSDGVDANDEPIYANDGTEDRLRAAGVHVFEATNRRTEFTAMHHKVGIFGLSSIRVVTDAANWTFAGLGSSTRVARNYESQLFIDTEALDGGRTGRRYLAQWLRVLERYAEQSAGDGEPSFDEVATALRGLPAWPRQEVVFTTTAETSFGESVYARGDQPALGDWDGLGLPLATDGDHYPRWESAPVALPLGIAFEWKLTASYGDAGSVRWENGRNRVTFVQPAPLAVTDALVLDGPWR
ncbi:MAG: hypothetical protein H6719_25140 [Sandaracinaceae bacterium]|nr:hypothetical protein [Sandaracinaceae bacterium]